MLKSIFYKLQYLSHHKQQYALILLDPHGALAGELLKFSLNSPKPQRLVYIDPVWEEGKTPCINPFWQKITNPAFIDLLAGQFAKTFAELVADAALSLQMEAVLKPCLAVLLEHGEASLKDLQVFMNDSQNEYWVELGKKSSFGVYRQFFQTAFLNKKYAATKLAIYTRLQHLQNNYNFFYLMNGKNTLDLNKEIQQGKVILFNLSKGKLGADASKAL